MEFKNDVELNGAGRALSEYELSIVEPEETYSTYYKKWIKKRQEYEERMITSSTYQNQLFLLDIVEEGIDLIKFRRSAQEWEQIYNIPNFQY